MLSPQALMKVIVNRGLNNPTPDGQENERFARGGRYGDVKVESAWPTTHLLADEGALMIAAMAPGATALQLGLSASFSATAAAFVLGNSDVPGGKRLYPLALKLRQLTPPTTGTSLRYAIVLDSINRTPTTISNAVGANQGPGTPATVTAYRAPVVCTNIDVNPPIVGVPYFPLSTAAGAPPTVPAASQFARIVTGNGFIKNSIPVALDQYVLQFGGVDIAGTFQAAAALAKITETVEAVVIGPGQFMLIYLWSPSNATAGNAWDDASLSWVEK